MAESHEYQAQQFDIVLEEPFNLTNTLLSGQTFAWSCIPNEELAKPMKDMLLDRQQRWYKLTDGERACLVAQMNEQRLIVLGQPGTMAYWTKYFRATETPFKDATSVAFGLRRLNMDLGVRKKLEAVIEESGRQAGIRVLNQDPWSTVVEFIISQRNSLKRIHKQVLGMLQLGPKVTLVVKGTAGEVAKYSVGTMPSAEGLGSTTGTELDTVGLGYRKQYLLETAQDMVKDAITIQPGGRHDVSSWLWYLKGCVERHTMSSYKILCYLEKFKGIGPKVANCIGLFGFGCRNLFPVDVWIRRMIDAGYIPEDTLVLGNSAGEIQQYLFWYAKKHGIN